MSRKRTLGGALVSAGLALSLAACGSASQSGTTRAGSGAGSTALDCHGCGKGKTITVLLNNWGAPTSGQTAWEKYVASQFKKDTGANVSYSTYLDVSQVQTTIDKDAVSHTGPDVFQTANTYVAAAVAAGVFNQKMTPRDWALVGGQSRFAPAGLQTNLIGTQKLGRVMVPQWLNDNLLAYNTQLFKEAHIAHPPTTWNEYVADAKKITALGHGVYGADFEPMDPLPWHIIYLLTRDQGGNFLNPQGTKATLTSPQVVKAVNFWFDFYRSLHISPPQSINWTATQDGAYFAKNKLGMLSLETSSILSAVAGQPAQGHVAFAAMPSVPYGMSSLPSGVPDIKSLLFAWNLGVTSWSHQSDLAYRFINIATSKPAELLMAKNYSDVPATKAGLAGEKDNKTLSKFVQYISNGIPTPASVGWVAMEVAVGNVTATLARDEQNGTYNPSTVNSVLAKADQQVDAALHS